MKYTWQISRAKRLIIVTTPGHVGSSTTYRSLLTGNWERGTRIYDIHSLDERFNNTSGIDSVSARHVLQEVLRRALVKKKLDKKELVIITLFRDPVARALGGLFQNPKVFLEGWNNKRSNAETLQIVQDKMQKSNFLQSTVDWQYRFYLRELKQYYSFDLVQKDYHEKQPGFISFHQQRRTLIVFALEFLDELLIPKIETYLNTHIQLKYFNTHSQRENRDSYQYCKEKLKLDNQILSKIYKNSILELIYPSKEIAAYYNNWSENPYDKK